MQAVADMYCLCILSRACRTDIQAVCAALSVATAQQLLALVLNDLLHERCTLCRRCWALRRPISSLTAIIPSLSTQKHSTAPAQLSSCSALLSWLALYQTLAVQTA
eukprot:19194-Heterococcus_DN1.PRE.2